MARNARPFPLVTSFLLTIAVAAPAQEPPKKEEKKDRDYSFYFQKPEKVSEFWAAITYELSVGRAEVAAGFLQGLLDKKPTEQDLLKLVDKEGMSALLRLRTVPQWSEKPAEDKKAKDNVEALISLAGDALRKHLENPERIARFIKNLTASPEERDYALKELIRSGPAVIPPLVDVLRQARGGDRLALLNVLPRLNDDTVPPLLAALDSGDPVLQAELIDVFRKRAGLRRKIDERVLSYLWYLHGSPRTNDLARQAATQNLADFLETKPDKLPPAKAALTKLAEEYYLHQASFPNREAVVVWRWEPKERRVVQGWPKAPTVPATQAEEYYVHRYASQALEIDPAYQPAQVLLLSNALDKAVERVGPDKPLGEAEAEVNKLLATAGPDLVAAVLERALNEGRTPVVLAAVRALGDLADVRATKPGARGEPPLLRALNYADRRVQMAAAEATLKVPGTPSPAAAGRVLDVLRRALGAEPEGKPVARKVLVGFANEGLGDEAARNVRELGYDAVVVRTGREALRRLNQAADIDALLLDAGLPDPGLASLVAQLRADVNFGRLPLILVASGERDEEVRRARDLYNQESKRLDEARRLLEQFKAEKRQVLVKRYEDESLRLEEGLSALSRRYAQESLRVEDALRRYVERYPATYVVAYDLPLDRKRLERTLQEQVARADSPPLSEAERKDYAERALAWLGKIARGELAGYDLRGATATTDAVVNALESATLSDQAVSAALDVVARLPGARAQGKLAAFLVGSKRPAPLRVKAAEELVRHVQQHGPALTPGEVDALYELYNQTADKALKPHVALVIGSLRPDPRTAGERLKDYRPREPGQPAEKPKEPEPPKDKDK